MTDIHAITPPPKLVQQWFLEAKAMPVDQWVTDVATQAARWGSDQELEACCEVLKKIWELDHITDLSGFLYELRAARRPKPPSLKEQVLAMLPEHPESMASHLKLTPGEVATIRRALESLPS